MTLPTPDVLHKVAAEPDPSRIDRLVADPLSRQWHLSDPVTGLPVRNAFMAALDTMCADSIPEFGLIVLDIDRFKQINELHGHTTGDAILRALARRLENIAGDDATIGYLGGDNFAVIVRAPAETLNRFARNLIDGVAEPLQVTGQTFRLTASAGFCHFPEHGTSRDTLFKHADAAMYYAKSVGRDAVQEYCRDISDEAFRRSMIESHLRSALADDGFEVHYQPKININTGELIGAEALVRLRTPPAGVDASPASFIPVAEESGLITAVGEWVLREACRQNAAWQQAGYPAIPVSVNVSALQFRDPRFVEKVAAILRATGLPAQCLELELTESITMRQIERTEATLASLKEMGVRLSIDDFGTGYSSFSYLRRFPIDTLKIDQSFIRDVIETAEGAAITCAIIDLGKHLKHRVIAEGVENVAQLDFLRLNGCDEIQGFYFSKPLPAAEFSRAVFGGSLIRKWAHDHPVMAA